MLTPPVQRLPRSLTACDEMESMPSRYSKQCSWLLRPRFIITATFDACHIIQIVFSFIAVTLVGNIPISRMIQHTSMYIPTQRPNYREDKGD